MQTDKENQFNRKKDFFLKKLDFLNWYRFYNIFKDVFSLQPKSVLEVGEGSGLLKSLLIEYVSNYETMDVNKNLNPTYLNDVRQEIPSLNNKYDVIIIADVLEHIPFSDLETASRNLYHYTKNGGCLVATIPHRASYFFLLTPSYVERVFRIPTGFLSWGAFYRRFIKRKIWIDPDHEWEIGDGKHSIKDVEKNFKKVGWTIKARKKLLYVDYWILKKL